MDQGKNKKETKNTREELKFYLGPKICSFYDQLFINF